jgi:demethylspheroidene O-methyltransferase
MSAGLSSPPLADAPAGGEPGRLRRLWLDLRDRLLVDAKFQRWAAAFPLTRFMARRRQRELFDLVAGFVYTQVLFSVVALRLLEKVAVTPQNSAELALECGMPRSSMDRLIAAAIPLRLLQMRGEGRIGLGDLGAALLGNPGVIAMVEHHGILYRDLVDPLALLQEPARPTELSAYWAYARNDAAAKLDAPRVADYSRLMAVSQSFIAEEILAAYPIERHKLVLDIGGGEGAFVLRAAEKAKQTQFQLFDLPAVAERAQRSFDTTGLAGRAQAHGGDLFGGSLPQGADLACLIRVLYDHDDERVRQILTAARESLAPGGTLLIAEPMAGTKGAERMGGAYFGMYLLAMKGGNSRSAERLSRFLLEARFEDVTPLRTNSPLLTSILLAKRRI